MNTLVHLVGGIAMTSAAIAFMGFCIFAGNAADQPPAVIAKMEQLGTVYVTWKEPIRTKAKSKFTQPEFQLKKNVVIGIDFRPMAGSDPKRVASVVMELAMVPELETVLLLGQPITDDVADAIPTTLKVTNIRFYNTRVTDKGVVGLTRFKNLQVFNYTGTGLTDEGMASIGTMTSLMNLTITDSKITDKGVYALQKLVNLQRLTIENSAASEASVQFLRTTLGVRGIRDFG